MQSNNINQKYPKVSIVVTAYNQASTITQTLDSILAQECNFPFEIIIGDDFSTDNTRSICLEYQKKFPKIVKLLFHSENLGVAANFTLSISQSKAKYIACCAADDYWNINNKLQLQVDFLESNLEFGIIYTDYDVLDTASGRLVKNFLNSTGKKCPEGINLITEFFNGKVPVALFTVCFRRELYIKYVPSDDFIKFNFPIEDWPTWLILSKYTKYKFFSFSTGVYRKGHESLSNQKSFNQLDAKYTGEKIMYKYLCDRFPEDLIFNEKGYDTYVYGILLNLAYKKRDYRSARQYSGDLINLGSSNLKIKSARNPVFFHLFWLFKKMKSVLS